MRQKKTLLNSAKYIDEYNNAQVENKTGSMCLFIPRIKIPITKKQRIAFTAKKDKKAGKIHYLYKVSQ